jgi:hypothetical protein
MFIFFIILGRDWRIIHSMLDVKMQIEALMGVCGWACSDLLLLLPFSGSFLLNSFIVSSKTCYCVIFEEANGL